MRTLKDRYFLWLCGRVKKPGQSYRILFNTLFDEEFRSLVAYDDNRLEDGKNLRQVFFNRFSVDEETYDYMELESYKCSVLEMMIALSMRMSDILSETAKDDMTSDIFWELLLNIKLSKFSDEGFEKNQIINKCKETSRILVERLYEPNGRGSLFPITNPKKDLRKVEIWYQMMAYLDENYNY